MADFCCHGFQLAYRALELDAPTRIEATGDDLGNESYPTRCTVTFDFAAKGKRGPVKLFFYSGDKHVPPEHIIKGPVGSTGCLVVGSEGTLSAGLWNTDCNIRLSDASDFQGANQPEVIKIAKTQSRIDTEVLKWDPKRAAKGERPRWSQVNNSHMFEWVLACAWRHEVVLTVRNRSSNHRSWNARRVGSTDAKTNSLGCGKLSSSGAP